MIKVGTDFSGVGAFDQALIRLGIDYETSFACDMDKYARNTYLLNFGTDKDMELLNTPIVKKIDDIYYRGFVNTKLTTPTQDEWDFVKEHEEKAARLFSFYYPWNVYSRVIPEESLDVSVHTCPCQSFSLAGKRKGEEDRRGVLFYNSHEFIAKNKPRYFMFENVKGLLSDDNGKTFQRWIDLLGGKSVNGNPVIFPNEESVPYHVYYKVLNAKEHGVPQNRERIFIIGIRDDSENDFNFPKPIHLKKRLKDVLEPVVDEKYFLSDKMIAGFMSKKPEFSKQFKPYELNDPHSDCLTARYAKMAITDPYIKTGFINQDTQGSTVFSENGISPTVSAVTHGYANGYVELSNEIIQLNDPIHSNDRIYSDKGISPTLTTMQGGHRQPFIEISDYVEVSKEVRSDESKAKRRKTGTNDFRGKEIEFRKQEFINTITTSLTNDHYVKTDSKRIRKLTPTECFRVMDFNPDFKNENSDTQKYKQAGNSVVVKHFVDLYSKLNIK